MGQTRRFRDVRGMSGLTPTADISGLSRHFALGPGAEVLADKNDGRRFRPIGRPMRCSVSAEPKNFRQQQTRT